MVGLAEWPGSPRWRMRGSSQGGRPGWSPVVPVGVFGEAGEGGNRCCLATCPQPDSAQAYQVPHLSPGSSILEGQCWGARDSEEPVSRK